MLPVVLHQRITAIRKKNIMRLISILNNNFVKPTEFYAIRSALAMRLMYNANKRSASALTPQFPQRATKPFIKMIEFLWMMPRDVEKKFGKKLNPDAARVTSDATGCATLVFPFSVLEQNSILESPA
jgi:hypothetical protein